MKKRNQATAVAVASKPTVAEIIAGLTNDAIECVYSGKPGCACGCKGNYWYTKKHAAAGGKRRGYPVDAEDISEAQVSRVLRIAKQNASDFSDLDSGLLTADIGTRVYIIRLATQEEAKKM